MTESQIKDFGLWISKMDFSELEMHGSSDQKVKQFREIMEDKINESFPEKTIKVFHKDKEFMNERLHQLRRQNAREYKKRKRSERYKKLHRMFLSLKKKNSQSYMKKKIEALRTSNPSSFFRKLKKVGARPGEDSNTFTIPSHIESNLTAKQSADAIADKFSDVSKEIEALNIENLPIRVKEKLEEDDA